MSLLDTASLIVTPNGYKEGKLYSVIPSDGSGDMSVTRATTATRVNSAGLVELVPYNLFTYSEQFDNAAWIKNNTTVTANATTSPDGTQNANKIADSINTASAFYSYQNVATSGTQYTSSGYFKKGEYNFVTLHAFGLNGAIFNLNTGVLVSQSGGTGTITSVGNGWYRCTFTFTATGSAVFFSQSPAGNIAYTGTIGNGIYVWGTQVVEGSTALPYQKTETRLNIPRLDYSNGTCPSLLVEPQRTNLVTYSSSFDNAAWTKVNATVTANYGISPDGTQNADRIQFTTSNSSSIYRAIGGATTEANTIYVKGVSGEKVLFGFAGNIASGTLYTLNGDWQRLEQISTIGSVFHIGNYNGGNATDILIWGAQREAGSYATSYIPTQAAAVTRNADVISKTGISSLIGQTEGTLFVEMNDIKFGPLGADFASIDDGTANNRMQFFLNTSNYFGTYNESGGVTQWLFISSISPTGHDKIALAYKNNDAVLYINGQLAGSTNSFSVPATSIFRIGDRFDNYVKADIFECKATALWKTRLTNTQLAQLTTI